LRADGKVGKEVDEGEKVCREGELEEVEFLELPEGNAVEIGGIPRRPLCC
jgi:hypothetical protein